jgi:hypothetical protein
MPESLIEQLPKIVAEGKKVERTVYQTPKYTVIIWQGGGEGWRKEDGIRQKGKQGRWNKQKATGIKQNI